MKKEINIAAILKDKPKGIRLYSPIFGECAFSFIQDVTDAICVTKHNGGREFFNTKGLYETLGECLLFPSKSMRDWSKVTWKKGDVLVSNDSDSHIIFTGFSKNDYTTFGGKHWISVSEKRYISYLDAQKTQCYHIEDDKEDAQTYINTIEERLGVKLNLETLEIEDFKDGAYWAINEFLKNLWHHAIEAPDLDKRILYEYKPNGEINPPTHIKEATYEKVRWKECGYKPINPERIITRCLYVDELQPKKGGKE